MIKVNLMVLDITTFLSNFNKACSGCLSVCYAGREEQKQDWKRHKAICKILQQFGKYRVSRL